MRFEIKKATRKELKARVALIGVSGSGKTYDALLIAAGLARRPDGTRGRIIVIDTENRSASKYAEDPALGVDFDVIELATFAPDTYIEAIRACEDAGAASIVIDSLSHAWMGKDGALEMKDKATAAGRSGNSFDAWRTVTPKHNALVDALLRCKAHLIATMRAKTDYVVEEVNGRKTPRKVGLAPVQRDGLEYEFDVVAEVNSDHQVIITKSRCSALAEVGVYDKADVRKMTVTLRSWLTGPGADATTAMATQPDEPSAETRAVPDNVPSSLPRDNGLSPSQASAALTAPDPVDHYDLAAKLIDGASTLPELAAAWGVVTRDHVPHLGPNERAAIVASKDARKASLSAAPPPSDDPPPDGPTKPRRGPRKATQGDAAADAPAATPGASTGAQDGPAAWLATEEETTAHAATLTTEWAVQASARKHNAALAATPWGVRVYAQRLQAMGVGTEAQCARYVVAWCKHGPKAAATAQRRAA